jgi:thiamine pyrophosphate-dependent acetolactate synthase large subunit-like protein
VPRWPSPAGNVSRCAATAGSPMLGLGDLLTQVQRQARVVNVIFNNGMLDFVNIEQQEAGFVPFGTDFVNPDFGKMDDVIETIEHNVRLL